RPGCRAIAAAAVVAAERESAATAQFVLDVRGLLARLLHERIHALAHFFWRQIFFARCDRPRVAFGIRERAAAIAPELIAHLSHRSLGDLAARRGGAIEERVSVLDINPEGDGRSAKVLG